MELDSLCSGGQNGKTRGGSASPKRSTVGVRAAVVALFVGLGVAAVSAGAGSLVFGDSLAVLLLIVEVGLLAGVVLFLVASGYRVSGALRLRRVPSGTYVLALKLGLALLLANAAATALLGPPVYDFELGTLDLWERIVFAVGVVLVAPIAEESLFRGLLQGSLESRMRPWLAIVVAAVPFALLHGPQPAVFFLFWSLPVGWVAWRTQSVRPGVVVHAINNLVGAVGLFAAGHIDSDSLEASPGAPWFAVLLLLVAAMWSVRLCQRVDELAASETRIGMDSYGRASGGEHHGRH
jgi:membrane protease YdiL (CAAX protease family)